MVSLDDYLSDAAGQPWIWGETDCCAFACRWVLLRSGLDPFAMFRGRYATEYATRRLILHWGSLEKMVRAAFAQAGLEMTAEPQDGDVGLVEATPELLGALPVSHQLMAVRKSGLWVMRTNYGIHAQDLPTVAAWAVPLA